MLLLTSTSDKLQVITSAAGDVEVHSSYADYNGTAVTVGRKNSNITTAATTDVVDPPGASTSRNVKSLHIANTHVSTVNTVTLVHTDGTTPIQLEQVTLQPGERISYREGVGMRVIDVNGAEKIQSPPLIPGAANTADQTANAADTYLAGSAFNISGRIQAGTIFRWVVSATKTAAGVATPIWNVRVGTAGTTGDTARLTFTGLAQTAAADTGMFMIDVICRTAGASGVLQGTYGLCAHRLAATGFANQAIDCAQATSATHDLTVSNTLVGVSVNPGASGVWTIKNVSLQVSNLLR